MELRGSLFRFFGNLVFVQHYSGFACFFRFGVVPGRPKIDEKSSLEKNTSKTRVFYKKIAKSDQNEVNNPAFFGSFFVVFAL